MGWLEEASVVKIGQLNVRIRYLYDTYSRATWDIHAFLERYVDRPYPLLCALHPDSALIYGEAVLGFFMRGSTPSPDLDICTTLPRFSRICEILETNGYRLSKAMAQYRSSEFSIQSELENIVERSLTTSPKRWSLAGDLSSEPNQHIGFKFPFRKTCSGARRKRINLHLIRCEPYRHVLAVAHTAFTCHISFDTAVFPFANSAVTHGESYALPNYLILNKDRPRTTTGTVKVTGSNLSREISILHGPPYGFKRSPYPELGHRYLGDESCWMITRRPNGITDPMTPPPRHNGPRFEAVDWLTFRDTVGSYMRIGEPFVLSSRYAHAIRQDVLRIKSHIRAKELLETLNF